MSNQILLNRDYTLILDKSGSMSSVDKSLGRSRWVEAEESDMADMTLAEVLINAIYD